MHAESDATCADNSALSVGHDPSIRILYLLRAEGPQAALQASSGWDGTPSHSVRSAEGHGERLGMCHTEQY